MPPEPDAVATETGGQMLDRVAAAHPDRDALIFAAPGQPVQRWTYRQLVADADRTARALLASFAPGENVAVWAANCAEWVLLQHGATRAGVRLVTINPAYLGREVAYVLRQSRSVGVFHAPGYRGTDLGEVLAAERSALPALRRVVSFADWSAFLDEGVAPALPAVASGDPVMIHYTSGTTGEPKGVLLSHRAILASARLVAERAELEEGVVSVNSMPLFHIGGCGTMELGTLSRAGTYVLTPGFDPAHVLELLEVYRGTAALAVPTMLIALLEHPDLDKRDLSNLRTVLTGGAAAPAELVRRVKARLGCLFTITFGQTETSGPAIQTSVWDSEVDQAETIGRPLPGMEARIVSPDTGAPLPPGEQGEICMRGPLVMLGYHDRPEDTAAAVDGEGWLHSGDLGTMDERGFLRITGRSRDMINRGGEKIYPREVETVLFDHDAISDVAVLGLPDDRWGEQVAAVIRLRDGAVPPTAVGLQAFAEERLARFKVPRRWFLATAFPQTPSGKIQKYVLREQLTGGANPHVVLG